MTTSQNAIWRAIAFGGCCSIAPCSTAPTNLSAGSQGSEFSRSLIGILLGFILMSGCTTTLLPRPESATFFSDTAAVRKEWVTRERKQPQIGLALAGGGTRAAQYAIGVLEGLNRSGVLEHVDVISSVSGGGYAAYGYFSRLLDQSNDTSKARMQLFNDCIPYAYKSIVGKNSLKQMCEENNYTNVIPGEKYLDPYRWQNNLRGRADLFDPEFNYEHTSDDQRFKWTAVKIGIPQIISTLVTEPLVDFAFDWNWDTEIPGFSSRRTYRAGIREVWGLAPFDCGEYMNSKTGTREQKETGKCWKERPPSDKPDITFQKLREAYSREDNDIPFWIINATTPVLNCKGTWYADPACTVRETATTETYPPHKAGFEITPFHWGSGEHGYWDACEYKGCRNQGNVASDTDTHGLGVVEAVAAAAAFFDPYEKTVYYLGIPSLVQKALGFQWGYYIANPVVKTQSPWERYLHRLLPFPLYLVHGWQEKHGAMDIHLIDGGQHEILGAMALIRRRIPNIIISDHAGESPWGGMRDICNMKKWLSHDSFAEVNMHSVWHIHIDGLSDLDRVCSSGDRQYNVYAWRNPVLKGCAIELNKSEYKQYGALESKPCYEWKDEKAKHPAETRKVLNIYVLKPAITLNEWIAKLRCISLASRDFDSCLTDGTDSTQVAGNTEVLGFLMSNSGLASGEGILFPRHTTVKLSIDSSPWLFGAYRELGALAANKLTLDADGNLQLSSKQIEQRSECSREVIDKITALSKTFQGEVREFCKRRGDEPLCRE